MTTNQFTLFELFIFTIDSDYPNRNEPRSQWLHWLVVNIPGDRIDLGETITEYLSPKPPTNSG